MSVYFARTYFRESLNFPAKKNTEKNSKMMGFFYVKCSDIWGRIGFRAKSFVNVFWIKFRAIKNFLREIAKIIARKN